MNSDSILECNRASGANDPLTVRFRLRSRWIFWNERIAGGSSIVLSRRWAVSSSLMSDCKYPSAIG